jgi:hypothetical protein
MTERPPIEALEARTKTTSGYVSIERDELAALLEYVRELEGQVACGDTRADYDHARKVLYKQAVDAKAECESLRAQLSARLRKLEKENDKGVRCCGGCPDCIGIGAHHEIRALRAQLEAKTRECEGLRESLKTATRQAIDGWAVGDGESHSPMMRVVRANARELLPDWSPDD